MYPKLRLNAAYRFSSGNPYAFRPLFSSYAPIFRSPFPGTSKDALASMLGTAKLRYLRAHPWERALWMLSAVRMSASRLYSRHNLLAQHGRRYLLRIACFACRLENGHGIYLFEDRGFLARYLKQ